MIEVSLIEWYAILGIVSAAASLIVGFLTYTFLESRKNRYD